MTRGIFVPLLLAFAAGMVGCSESTSMPTGPSAPELVTVSPPAPSPAPVPVPPAPVAPPTARYEVMFDSTWSASTHPTDFPADAHYSGLVGGTHTSGATFWRPGSLASEGIRRMAERGAKSPLTEEVGAAITAGTAQYVLSDGNLPTSPGSVRMEFDISQTFPLVTLVTMIAPSPDWFVGVAGLPLFENGDWVSVRQVPLLPYDAGTDSGVTYRSPDEETVPRQPISLITGSPMIYAGGVAPLGTFTFKRIQ